MTKCHSFIEKKSGIPTKQFEKTNKYTLFEKL